MKEKKDEDPKHLPNHSPMLFGKLACWIRHVRHIYWLIGIAAGLIMLLMFLPDSIWIAFWSSLRHHVGLAVMLLLLALLSLSLIWTEGQRIDAYLFCFLNACGKSNRPRWMDNIMLGFTQLGNGAFTVILALVFFLKKNWMFAYELILSTFLLWFVVEFIKVFINRSRPFKKLSGARVVGRAEKGRSFPSGHTSQSFYLATLMVQYFGTGLYIGMLLYFLAFLVGITRIYVGAHYPRDVMAGAVLGTIWGLIGVIANQYIF